MKTKTLFITIVLTSLLWSCGGNSNKNEENKDSKVENGKEIALDTEDGMMTKLKEFNVILPEGLVFIEITKESGTYKAKFEHVNADEAKVAEYGEWYTKQLESLEAEGWKKRAIRENEVMFGTVYNQNLFYKAKEGESSRQNAIDLSSSFSEEEMKFTVNVSLSEV